MIDSLMSSETENIMNKSSSVFEEKGGSWNESGLVLSLDRKGFTPNKCCTELIANSIDAQAITIEWKITSEYIKLIDDGTGMGQSKLKDMFDMFKTNNSDRKTMGVSGLGGKEGMYNLSKKTNKEPTTTILYTHTNGGDYLKAIVPWKEIFNEQKYTGKVLFTMMSQEEINDFIEDRTNFNFKHGTTIRFEYNDDFKNLIEKQFDNKITTKEKFSQHDRWDFVFGLSISNIILEKTDGTPRSVLSKYDYFSGNDTEFYAGKQMSHILHYIDDKNNDRYILNEDGDTYLEIQHYGKNSYKTDPTPIIIHQLWKKIGSYEILNGMRVNNDIFNPNNPYFPNSATMHINNYDGKYFPSSDTDVEYIKACLSGCGVYRNCQLITKISFDNKKFNASTSRGDAKSMITKFYHRTEIRYSTLSSQDNRMDIAMGIQENKNQHHNCLPTPLERLITHVKQQHIVRIYTYFETVIDEYENKKHEILAAEKSRKAKSVNKVSGKDNNVLSINNTSETEVNENEVTEAEVNETEVNEPDATETEVTEHEVNETEIDVIETPAIEIALITEDEVTKPEVNETPAIEIALITEDEVTKPEVNETPAIEIAVTEPVVNLPENSKIVILSEDPLSSMSHKNIDELFIEEINRFLDINKHKTANDKHNILNKLRQFLKEHY